MLTRDEIEKKISDLEKQRDTYIQQVNQQIGFFSGQIAALKEMLAEPKPQLKEVKNA